MIRALVILLLRIRQRQLERHITGCFDLKVSRELDQVLAAREALG